jgi:hypothetical protein
MGGDDRIAHVFSPSVRRPMCRTFPCDPGGGCRLRLHRRGRILRRQANLGEHVYVSQKLLFVQRKSIFYIILARQEANVVGVFMGGKSARRGERGKVPQDYIGHLPRPIARGVALNSRTVQRSRRLS